MKLRFAIMVLAATAACAEELCAWQKSSDSGPVFRDTVGRHLGELMWKEIRFTGLGIEIWPCGRKLSEPEPADWPFLCKNTDAARRNIQFRLSKPTKYFPMHASATFATAPMETFFGTIRPTFALQWTDMDITGDWAHVSATYEYKPEGDALGLAEEGRMRIIVSRLSPAVLITVYGLDSLRIFEHENPDFSPARYFFSNNETFDDVAGAINSPPYIEAFEVSNPESLKWLLAWGKESTVPFLVLFPKSPLRLEVGARKGGYGCTIEFGEEENNIALLPLFGDFDTPADFSKTVFSEKAYFQKLYGVCEAWWERLGYYPVSVAESYSYDAASDTARLTEEFEFLQLRENAAKFSPVPPMISIAVDAGFPLAFSAEFEDTGMVTDFGPVRGIPGTDRYEMTVRGIGKYLFERLVPAAQGPAADLSNRLAGELAREIEKMLDAGKLAYVLYSNGLMEGRTKPIHPLFINSGETIQALALAYDLLPADDIRKRVREYLAAESAARPCLVAAFPDINDGARRERYVYPEYLSDITDFLEKRDFYCSHNIVPPENIYAEYQCRRIVDGCDASKINMPAVDAALLPYLRKLDWAGGFGYFSLPPHRGENIENTGIYETYFDLQSQFGGVGTMNGFMSGLTGYARLAAAAGDKARRDMAAGLWARAAAVRYAMAKYPRYLHTSGLAPQPPERLKFFAALTYKYGFRGPEDNPQQVARMDQRRPFLAVEDAYTGWFYSPVKSAVPEVCRFLRDYLQPEIKMWAETMETCRPDWWLNHYSQIFVAGEKNFALPENSFALFVAKAMVTDELPEKLAVYADSSWLARGDLHYIAKLAHGLYAARGMSWAGAEGKEQK